MSVNNKFDKIGLVKKRACRIKFNNEDGMAFFNVLINGRRYIYANFSGLFLLIKDDLIKVEKGNLDNLETEIWV